MKKLIATLTTLSLLAATGPCFADTAVVKSAGCEAFLEQATQDAMTQIALGKVAEKNARSMGINALGSRMARDHARMNRILGLISHDKGISVPTSLDAEHRAIVDSLSSKTGAEFDVAYAALMVSDHTKAIAFYSDAAQSDDQDVAVFARSALPALREQKRLADSFQKMTAGYRAEPTARLEVAAQRN
ncbi:MAG: DUF4142 domain-containing protein [Gammaproteobacteria bacterium]